MHNEKDNCRICGRQIQFDANIIRHGELYIQAVQPTCRTCIIDRITNFFAKPVIHFDYSKLNNKKNPYQHKCAMTDLDSVCANRIYVDDDYRNDIMLCYIAWNYNWLSKDVILYAAQNGTLESSYFLFDNKNRIAYPVDRYGFRIEQD